MTEIRIHSRTGTRTLRVSDFPRYPRGWRARRERLSH
jgi:hypothetical protein